MSDWDYLKHDDLPEKAKEVAEWIGFEATVALMKNFPLSGVYIPKSESINNTIVGKILDRETAERLALFYQGETLFLSKALALKKAKNRRIKAEAEHNISAFPSKGKYYAYVSEREGICISRIREIINSLDTSASVKFAI